MQHRKPKPRLDLGSLAHQATLAEALASLGAPTAEQIAAWARKRGKQLPKATLYRLLAKAVAGGELAFLELDGRRFYHPPGNRAWIFHEGHLKPAALPLTVEQDLTRFATEEGPPNATFALVIR